MTQIAFIVCYVLLMMMIFAGVTIGRRIGRTQMARQQRELSAAPECLHVWGQWEPHNRHTATEFSGFGGGRSEKYTPVLRRTCEVCQWQEDKKVPLS